MARRTLSIPEPEVRVLNASCGSEDITLNSTDLSKTLQQLMLRLKGESMSDDGSSVNYEKIKKSSLFQDYLKLTGRLQKIDVSALSEKEKLAFFINIYNSLTIHGLVSCENLPKSVLDIQLFWRKTAYNMGGDVYSLDDIEHGILRGNRPHPASKSPPFKLTDPRLKHAAKKLDPRIHFALVCGAKSCPPINVYTADNLEKALDMATRSFVRQEISVYYIQKEIHVSRIFQWYKADFGENDVAAIRWTKSFLEEGKQADLERLLCRLEEKGMVDISYKDYNWSLNCML